MQLTRAADYAVRLLIHLAMQPEGTIVSKAILAKQANAPESFVAKILQVLSRAGFIQTRRGVIGGFSLLPKGRLASLLEVIEAVDGPISLNLCLVSGDSCNRQPECLAHNVWVDAQEAMVAVLRNATIDSLVPATNSGAALLSIGTAAPKSPSKIHSHAPAARREPAYSKRT